MLVAAMSDIHDNIWKLETALKLAAQAEVLIFCGDFCAPFTLKQIAEGFKGRIHVVWGNNDGDKWLLTRNAGNGGHVILHGDFGEVELDGSKIAITHYPQIAGPVAESGTYATVFYGHDHTPNIKQEGKSLLINPGEVMGRFGRSTFAMYDTSTRKAEIMDV
ncbi:MAG: metallophosphoesterase [Deltaproteobacteria bacterium]|nr:metallophosphoesterase [Deltaproteobacteria bacterium]